MEFCSPVGEDNFKENKTCFSLKALKDLAKAWNDEHPKNRIKNINKLDIDTLWENLNKKMSPECGPGKEYCWIKKINPNNRTNEIKNSIRPEKPSEWYKNKNAWLSNYEIQNVMKQYQEKKDLKYKFIGVFSIDFEKFDSNFNSCLINQICTLDIITPYKQGYEYLGMITNLDKHDEPGSHWTSLFICINPKKPCFGAHYYDSTANLPPKEINEFVAKLKVQAEEIKKLAIKKRNTNLFNFAFNYNNVRHQYGNNECGMFSMVYQIRWLSLLKKNKNTKLLDVISAKLTDKQMNQYFRNKLFAPNTKIEIDNKK